MFIVTKTIDSENIRKLCRTCLREDCEKMAHLFAGPATSSLAAKLRSLSCLEVSQGDGLPEKMCDRCIARAESALLFREQCRAADQALRQAACQVAKLSSHETCTKTINAPSYNSDQQSNSAKFTSDTTNINSPEFYVHNYLYRPQSSTSPPGSVLYNHKETLNDLSINHMHIVESNNCNLNASRFTGTPIIGHDRFNSADQQLYLESYFERASCALYCSLCNHTFADRMQLAQHSFTHNSDSNVDLSCNDVSVDVEENSVDQEIENSIINYSFKTNICNDSEVITMESSLTGQANVASNTSDVRQEAIAEKSYQKENRYKCEKCCRLFSDKCKFLSHRLLHEDDKSHKCIHCTKSYSSKSKFNAHMKLHTRTNIHQCEICKKIFSYPSYLAEHMKVHNAKDVNKKASYGCNQCKKKFYFIKSFKRHLKTHEDKDLFQCDICDKIFNHKYSLKVHMQSHIKSNLYKCDVCDKSFNQKSNLVEHTRTHTKIKPFKCKLCEKSFTQSSHLKNHELSHKSFRQHHCRLCGKSFKLSSHLKRHYNSHTGLNKVYKCDQCNQMFSQAFSLKRHSKKHTES